MRGNASPVQTCQAFCPASVTKVFYGSTIDGATASNGERYADSENAFAYRKALRADCTCNGRSPSGLAPVDLTLDTSLRSGDVIATTDGLVAYTGVRLGAGHTAEFTPVASYPGLTADVRARLGEMKVAPVSAEMVGRNRDQARDPPRSGVAGIDGAEDDCGESGEAGGSELVDVVALMARSAQGVRLRTMLRIAGRTTKPRCRHPSRRGQWPLPRMRTVHRPTMTPITFGADRYLSSIAARAAARFSGVSNPRFSASIIQQ